VHWTPLGGQYIGRRGAGRASYLFARGLMLPAIRKAGRLVMDRRRLLKVAGATAVAGAMSAPAIAQSAPTVKWRLTTSFPKTLDTLYGACDLLAKTVADLSDQKFQITVHGPGEIVPSF